MTMSLELKQKIKEYARHISHLFANSNIIGELKNIGQGGRHIAMGIRLRDSTDLQKALSLEEPVKLATSSNNVRATIDQGLVVYEIELPDSAWQIYTVANFASIPDRTGMEIGYKSGRKPVRFDFKYPHTIVAGGTGAGKTEAMKTIMYALCSHYTPQEFCIHIIDPHYQFTEFRSISHVANLVHTQQEISDLFEKTQALMDSRLVDLRNENPSWPDKHILVMDECQTPYVFGTKDNKTLNMANIAIASRMATEARKLQMHLLLGTQKPLSANLPGILDQITNRYVGLVQKASESSAITGRPQMGAQLSTGNGDFIHVAGPFVERLQFALTSPSDLQLLSKKPIIRSVPRADCEIDPAVLAQYMYNPPKKGVAKYMKFKASLLREMDLIKRG